MTGTALQTRHKRVRLTHISILLALVLVIMLLFLAASTIADADARQMMMRGDLLFTFAFSVGYAAAFAFCLVLCLGSCTALAGVVAKRGGHSSWLTWLTLPQSLHWTRAGSGAYGRLHASISHRLNTVLGAW